MKILAAIVAAIAYVLLTGWLFMLTVGVIRGEWLAELPTIGYSSAVLVAAFVSSTLGALRGNLASKSET